MTAVFAIQVVAILSCRRRSTINYLYDCSCRRSVCRRFDVSLAINYTLGFCTQFMLFSPPICLDANAWEKGMTVNMNNNKKALFRDGKRGYLPRRSTGRLWTATDRHISFSPSHLSWPSPCAGPAIILVVQYFDLVPCLQSFGISSCLPLCCSSISFSVDFCSSSQKLPVSTISHRRGWVLVSNSGQTTLVFCLPGKFQHVLCVPPSWCLHFWCIRTWARDYKRFFEHVSALNSQSVLRNDVTLYALARCVWDLFWVGFLYSLGPWSSLLPISAYSFWLNLDCFHF